MSLKLAINNEIISMRDKIIQAKVHTISKLTKEIKLLRNKKGTEQQTQKYKRKADRLVEEILILKKNKPDDVTRFILAQDNLKKIIECPTSSEKEKIFAKIGLHKSVVPKIKTLKEKYPGPLDEFLTPGKKRQIKIHRKELKTERKKERKLMYEARQKHLMENFAENPEDYQEDEEKIKSFENQEEKSNVSRQDSDTESEEPKQTTSNEVVETSSNSENEEKSDDSNEESNDEHEIESVDKNDEITNVCKTPKENKPEIKNKSLKRKSIDLPIKESKASSKNTTEPVISNKKKIQIKPSIEENQPESINNNHKEPPKKMLKTSNVSDFELDNSNSMLKNRKRNEAFENTNNKRFNFCQPVESFSNSIAEIKPFSQIIQEDDKPEEITKVKNSTGANHSDTEENNLEKSVDSFFLRTQGNEAYLSVVPKANNDSDTTQIQRHYNDNLNRRQRRQKEQFGYVKDNSQKNRRSQNLRFGDKSFINTENRKITVDNFKDPKEEEKLHPSWAAKKQMQPQILAFQGKKITFD